LVFSFGARGIGAMPAPAIRSRRPRRGACDRELTDCEDWHRRDWPPTTMHRTGGWGRQQLPIAYNSYDHQNRLGSGISTGPACM